jgi:hypothetical protein
MTNTASDQDLGQRIERLIEEHIAASRRAAQAALERAFGSAACAPVQSRRDVRRASGNRRAPDEVATLGERLYQAVCANPGEGMIVLAADVGASARELHRPMTLLKRAGRVRSVGARRLTRYFPMATKSAASASPTAHQAASNNDGGRPADAG